jgi:predicted nucleic acid-binding protein
MNLVYTSVWVELLRDRTGKTKKAFQIIIGEAPYVLCRFTQLELLQGAKDEREWRLLDEYLAAQYYLETGESTWREAARIWFALRRKGLTISSPVDCCIAQIALEADAFLLHRDRDFEKIARVRPLKLSWFEGSRSISAS